MVVDADGEQAKKNFTINSYLRDTYSDGYKECIGIAYDEPNRLKNDSRKVYPLFYYKMTERDCLKYCYEKGYFWEEDGIRLYDILDRVSCWCCANKNLKELRNYYKHLPKYWDKLKQFQERTSRPFKSNKYTIFDLEERFRKEDE